MIEFAGRGLLLDIEGTTSSVRFVYDVLFPYARSEVAGYLSAHWEEPEVVAACEQIARDVGHPSLIAACGPQSSAADQRSFVLREVYRLMDQDAKATGLKSLQGLVWESGYTSGLLESHIYPDLVPALEAWTAARREVRIYSSGSVAAQKLFFAHTIQGNLLGYFGGHYDTVLGPKKVAESYRLLSADWGLAPDQILFASDVSAELDAAREAGFATALVVRPGNAPSPAGHGHPVIESFDQIRLV